MQVYGVGVLPRFINVPVPTPGQGSVAGMKLVVVNIHPGEYENNSSNGCYSAYEQTLTAMCQ